MQMAPKKETNVKEFTVTVEAAPAKKERKICILGTAPQWQLAPFDDPSWEIWGIYGTVGAAKRMNRLYEVHDKSIIEPMANADKTKEYFKFAASLGENYITKDHYDQTPNARRFDFESKIKKYGPYFASSAAWLIAEAIDEGATSIGMFGINMADGTEYAHQKPSCTFMLGFAHAKGIQIVIPTSSELMAVSHQYGYEKCPAAIESINQKRAEIEQQLAAHRNNFNASQMGVYGAEQSLNLLKWMETNWK